MNILKFTLKNNDFDVVIDKNTIAYAFEHNGNHFANKITIPSKKTQDVVSAAFLVLINAIETIENYENSRIQGGVESAG